MQEALTKFATMLSGLEIPVSNGEFLDETECPYIAFFVLDDNSIYANGVPICINAEVDVHLVTKGIRDYAKEAALEALLNTNGYPWSVDYTQNIEQRVYECTYKTTILE